jgi:hypothetical protein
MKQIRTNQPTNIGALLPFAGIPAQVTTPQPNLQETPSNGMPMAFYPYLYKECQGAIMANYRRYISAYNQEVKTRNRFILKHNQDVRDFLAECQDKALIKLHECFEGLNPDLNVHQYNARAWAACNAHGPVVFLKKIRKVRTPLQQTFSLIVYNYSTQLATHSQRRKRYPVKTLTNIPAIDLNAYLLTRIKCDKESDVYSLDYCPETVRNHRQILEEAGVLVNYVYRGSYRGVHVHINPEILVFFDAESEKYTGTENQLFTCASGKDFGEVLVVTGSSKEEKESKPRKSVCVNKVPGHTPAPNKPQGHLAVPGHSLATPSPQGHHTAITGSPPSAGKASALEKNSPGAGAADAQNVVDNPHSDALRSIIQDPVSLANELTAGNFDNYKPLEYNELAKEVQGNGNLSREEFAAFFVQIMFKYSAATLYHGRRDIYAGAWFNAYKHWLDHKFTLPNGAKQTKSNMLAWYQEYIWRINWAKTWFDRESRKSKKILQPSPPPVYFNSHRKLKACLAFQFTAEKWKTRLDKQDPELKLQRMAAKEAIRLKERSSNMRKYDAKMAEYFANKITIDGLFTYIERNLPAEYHEKAIQDLQSRAAKVGLKVFLA